MTLILLRHGESEGNVLRRIQGWHDYRLTDRAPGPSGYRYLIQGVAAAEKVLVTFTVLSHFRDVPEIAEALAMVRSVRGE